MLHKPADPITFLEQYLAKARNTGGASYEWTTIHSGDSDMPATTDILSVIKNPTDALGTVEDEPTTSSGTNSNNEEKLKIVTGKTILFVLGECIELGSTIKL